MLEQPVRQKPDFDLLAYIQSLPGQRDILHFPTSDDACEAAHQLRDRAPVGVSVSSRYTKVYLRYNRKEDPDVLF